jgi:prolipoprotein diacylglyceryltransferase
MGGLILVHAVVRRSADRWVVSVFCAGFGLVRLGVEPWRAAPPLGEPAISPAWIAAAWVVAGVAAAGSAVVPAGARSLE